MRACVATSCTVAALIVLAGVATAVRVPTDAAAHAAERVTADFSVSSDGTRDVIVAETDAATTGGGADDDTARHMPTSEELRAVGPLQPGGEGYDAPLPDRVAAFVAWLEAHDVDTSAFELRNVSPDQLGVFASRSWAQGETSITMPRTLAITPELFQTDPTLAKVAASLSAELPDMDDVLQLALVLLYEAFYNGDSTHKPYFHVLPRDYSSMPFLWVNDDELALLTLVPGLGQQVNAHASRLMYWFHSARVNAFEKHPEIFGEGEGSVARWFNQYKWAYATALSRVFSADTSQQGRTAVVPLMDHINHEAGRLNQLRHIGDGDGETREKRFAHTADKDYAEGEEILTSYDTTDHTECNFALLTTYGFASNDTANDCMVLRLSIARDPRPLGLLKWQMNLDLGVPLTPKDRHDTVQNATVGTIQIVMRDRDPLPALLVQVFRISHLAPQDLTQGNADALARGEAPSLMTEAQALRTVLSTVASMRASLDMSLQQLVEAGIVPENSEDWSTAVSNVLRIFEGQLRILAAAEQQALKTWESLLLSEYTEAPGLRDP